VEGDDHGEAYTVIVWGVGLSLENLELAGAETVATVEGNMCGAATRGTVALPWSKATSRTKGSRRNLGDLVSPEVTSALGPRQEVEETKLPRKARGVGRVHTTDEAFEQSCGAAAESVEGRDPAGRKGRYQSMPRTQRRNRHVTGGTAARIEAEWAAQAPNVDAA
jgi:hypothetical protein